MHIYSRHPRFTALTRGTLWTRAGGGVQLSHLVVTLLLLTFLLVGCGTLGGNDGNSGTTVSQNPGGNGQAHIRIVGSTALMEWLVTEHGLPLRRAKHMLETAVRLSEQAGADEVTPAALQEALSEHGVTLDLDAAQVAAVQRPEASVHAARAIGGPAPEAVDAAIAALREGLDESASRIDAMRARIADARARLRAAGEALGR